MPRKIYQYKFIVDDKWKISKFHPTILDSKGNLNNIIDINNHHNHNEKNHNIIDNSLKKNNNNNFYRKENQFNKIPKLILNPNPNNISKKFILIEYLF